MPVKQFKDDFSLVLYALKNPPSLIIDCANAANPHRFYPYVPYENFRQAFVVSVDAIYRYRDTLKNAEAIACSVGAVRIAITSHRYLFSYQDKAENRDVLKHCRDLIQVLSDKFEVSVV